MKQRFFTFFWNIPLDFLDGVAAKLITGVGDEKTAFEIFGEAYCATVAAQYDVICMARSESGRAYTNLIELYKIWSGRLSRSELEKARKELDRQIERIPVREIPPLSPVRQDKQ